jgi:hypothetical protein
MLLRIGIPRGCWKNTTWDYIYYPKNWIVLPFHPLSRINEIKRSKQLRVKGNACGFNPATWSNIHDAKERPERDTSLAQLEPGYQEIPDDSSETIHRNGNTKRLVDGIEIGEGMGPIRWIGVELPHPGELPQPVYTWYEHRVDWLSITDSYGIYG